MVLAIRSQDLTLTFDVVLYQAQSKQRSNQEHSTAGERCHGNIQQLLSVITGTLNSCMSVITGTLTSCVSVITGTFNSCVSVITD